MATLKQVEAATAALGMTWAQIVAVCRADLGEHGVLAEARLERLERVEGPGVYRVGDVVAVRGHGRYRAARVWKVSRRSARVSAMYLTPSSLAESRLMAPTLCNSTGIPAGLLSRISGQATTDPCTRHAGSTAEPEEPNP